MWEGQLPHELTFRIVLAQCGRILVSTESSLGAFMYFASNVRLQGDALVFDLDEHGMTFRATDDADEFASHWSLLQAWGPFEYHYVAVFTPLDDTADSLTYSLRSRAPDYLSEGVLARVR